MKPILQLMVVTTCWFFFGAVSAAPAPGWGDKAEISTFRNAKASLAASNTAGMFYVVDVKRISIRNDECERVDDFDVTLAPVLQGKVQHSDKYYLIYRKSNDQCPGSTFDHTPVLIKGEMRYLRLSCDQKECQPTSTQFFAHSDEQLDELINKRVLRSLRSYD